MILTGDGIVCSFYVGILPIVSDGPGKAAKMPVRKPGNSENPGLLYFFQVEARVPSRSHETELSSVVDQQGETFHYDHDGTSCC
jgi:hypothetical protein